MARPGRNVVGALDLPGRFVVLHRPGGPSVNSQGREPLDPNPNTTAKPRRGDSATCRRAYPRPNRLCVRVCMALSSSDLSVALAGLAGMDAFLFQGLAPLAMDTCPFGAAVYLSLGHPRRSVGGAHPTGWPRGLDHRPQRRGAHRDNDGRGPQHATPPRQRKAKSIAMHTPIATKTSRRKTASLTFIRNSPCTTNKGTKADGAGVSPAPPAARHCRVRTNASLVGSPLGGRLVPQITPRSLMRAGSPLCSVPDIPGGRFRMAGSRSIMPMSGV